MCKNAVKKLLIYWLRYVYYQCKTQQMCGKPISENDRALKSVSDCCKN